MRKTLLFTIFGLLAFLIKAQDGSTRYYDKIFDEVQSDTGIVYGANYVYDILQGEIGLTQEDQTIDIYYPPNTDTETKRPLIIWAHGGSFLNGTKNDADIVYFCNEFVKRGFVCASINYRLGYELPIDSVAAVRTVYRALQDGRASIRYMRSVADEYGIDTSRIYFGGTSAGAFIALNMAYLNLPEELPNYVDTSDHQLNPTTGRFGLGNIEGTTNDIQESSEFHGIINFCGATKHVAWMDDSYSRSFPSINMHGTIDGTVPYATRVINLNDLTPLPAEPAVPIVGVQGSYDIDKHADAEGYSSKFYTWYGADHVPYINFHSDSVAALYMDTLMSFTVKYVYEDFLGFGTVPGLEENDPPCDFNNGDEVPCAAASVDDVISYKQKLLYPNPTSDVFTLENLRKGAEVKITNSQGVVVFQSKTTNIKEEISVEDFTTGLYFVEVIERNKRVLSRKIQVIK